MNLKSRVKRKPLIPHINNMKISLIVNTFNRMHTLPNTLRSLEYLRYPNLEVIVVDGPSTDGTLEYLQTNWKEKIKICKCEEANLSKSRNIGIQNASGEIVCFTDDDGIPEPDWLDQLVIAYDDPNVAAAGGWVRNHTGVEYQTKYIVSSRASTSEVQITDPALVPPSIPYQEHFPGLIGVNSSFRKKALLDVGGFDEEYSYFLDETDLLARLIDAGFKVKSIPDAEVHHKYAPSHIRTTNGVARSWLQIMTSTAYYILKNSLPETNLADCFETIHAHKENLKIHTNWYLSQEIIDEDRYSELISEIDIGANKGIGDAFEYPSRKLILAHEPTNWNQFTTLLASEKRLRLAFVTALYPPRACGGVAVFINNLAKQLAKAGHEITVITQSEPGNGHTVDFEDGVWVHRLPDSSEMICECPAEMPDMPEQQKRIAGIVLAEINRVFDRRKFQFVIGSIWDLDLAAVIASKKYPVAMYLVTSYKLMEESKPEWRENRDFYKNHVTKMIAAEKWALSQANCIISSTHAILQDTEIAYNLQINRNSLRILPFGVPDINNKNSYYSNDKKTIEVLYVGRLEKRKGADIVLDIIPRILTENSCVCFRIIGDSTIASEDGINYKENFLSKFQNSEWIDRVKFCGHVDQNQLEKAYADCDIFVAPSRYESFGLIYLEAMRFGKPCIGTWAGGIPEVIADQQTGLLALPGDSTSLFEVIDRLIKDPELRAQMGEAGRKRYSKHFTVEKFAFNFEKLIRDLNFIS